MLIRVKPRAHSRRILNTILMMGLAIEATSLTGCPCAGLPDSAAFSEIALVPVAAETSVEASLGAGATALVDSTWAVYRASDDVLLFRILFGPGGEVERLFDSFVFAQPWLGSEIIADTEPHPTAFAGGSYVSGAYTAEQNDSVGVLGVLHGLLLGTHLGTATLSLSGQIDGDRIEGTMVRTVMVFAPTPFPAPGDAQFDAYAIRER